MPPFDAAENNVDLRHIGAGVGAALPGVSLLEYLLSTLPKYRKMIREAPDWTRADGNVDILKGMQTLRPGDIGVSGLQKSESGPLVNFLIGGSASASGGPGAHGQIVGPHIQAPYGLSNTPKGGQPPALPFLMNEGGELYSPALARDRKKFLEEILPGSPNYLTHTGGADRYGRLKVRLNALSKQLQEAKRTGADVGQLRAQRDKVLKQFKDFLTPVRETPTGGEVSKGLREFFDAPVQAKMRTNMDEIRRLMRTPDSPEVLAAKKRLESLAGALGGANTPRSKALADEIRRTAQSVGVKDPASLARSRLFKPKAFETFIPTLHHGGILGAAEDPLFKTFFTLPEAMQKEIAKREGVGLGTLRKQLRKNLKQMAKDRVTARRMPWKFNASNSLGIDNVYDDLAKDKSQFYPKGYYADQPRGTVWARPDVPADPRRLTKSLQGEAMKSYASSDAVMSGVKEVTGINTLRRWFPWLQKIPGIGGAGPGAKSCWGNHCGSMPSAVLDDIGAVKAKLPHADVLPNTLLLDKKMKILGVTNKPLIMKQLSQMARRRGLLGLGAMGLMGAAGWGAGGIGNAAQNMFNRSPNIAAKPTLDPAMLANVKKTLGWKG